MVLQLRMETGWSKFYFWDLAYTSPTFAISKIQERSNTWYSSTSQPREQPPVNPRGSVSPCTSQETTLCRLIWVRLNRYAGGYLYVCISEKFSLHAAYTWYVRTLLTWEHVEGRSPIYCSRQCGTQWPYRAWQRVPVLTISVTQNAYCLVRGDTFETRILKAGTKI